MTELVTPRKWIIKQIKEELDNRRVLYTGLTAKVEFLNRLAWSDARPEHHDYEEGAKSSVTPMRVIKNEPSEPGIEPAARSQENGSQSLGKRKRMSTAQQGLPSSSLEQHPPSLLAHRSSSSFSQYPPLPLSSPSLVAPPFPVAQLGWLPPHERQPYQQAQQSRSDHAASGQDMGYSHFSQSSQTWAPDPQARQAASQLAHRAADQAACQSQYGAPPPMYGPDRFTEMLDMHAAVDPQFQTLRTIVDARRASVAQLDEYCRHVDSLNHQRMMHGWPPLYSTQYSPVYTSMSRIAPSRSMYHIVVPVLINPQIMLHQPTIRQHHTHHQLQVP